MAALLPSLEKNCLTASLMSFGYDPDLMERDPYEGAKGSVREALAKFACLGGDPWKARLSFQEYFEHPGDLETWGRPAAALLGALEAQLYLGVPAIGGKDSMSGNYRDAGRDISLAVPPTLVAFAAGTAPAASIRSGALSGKAGNVIILLAQTSAAEQGEKEEWNIFRANMNALAALGDSGFVCSAYPVGAGGLASSLALMAFGNTTGLELDPVCCSLTEHSRRQGSILVEIPGKVFSENREAAAILAGAGSWAFAAKTIAEPVFRIRSGPAAAEKPLAVLRRAYEYPLSRVYPQTSTEAATDLKVPEAAAPPAVSEKKRQSRTKFPRGRSAPLVVLPVFPGTNGEWDMERAFREAGARTRLVIFRNRNREDIAESIQELSSAVGEAQILAFSGGFSAGDEPEGSGKFIANVLRSPALAEEVTGLIEKRDGLILGICNGFQALIKLGLVPYGAFRSADDTMPTLTFNRIGRHVSRMVRTRVMSTLSPWLSLEEPGAVHVLPVSHGEGRLVIRREEGEALFKNGQVPFCYADMDGQPAPGEPDNPNGSDFAIESLTSPDGRILGKMGHSERRGEYVHINIPGNKRQNIFEAGLRYFA
jgi:phosphoribosylformylglycinamidine synthase